MIVARKWRWCSFPSQITGVELFCHLRCVLLIALRRPVVLEGIVGGQGGKVCLIVPGHGSSTDIFKLPDCEVDLLVLEPSVAHVFNLCNIQHCLRVSFVFWCECGVIRANALIWFTSELVVRVVYALLGERVLLGCWSNVCTINAFFSGGLVLFR